MSIELKLIGGGAAQGFVGALAQRFEAETGAAISGTYSAVGAMRDQIIAGAPADVVILSRPIIDALVAGGHVVASSIADVGRVPTSLAVRTGDPVPRVATADDLRAALLAADAVYTADTRLATAGIHVQRTLEALGIAGAVADRLRVFPNGMTAMAAMARQTGGCPLGCTQVTEILHTPGLTVIGNLPPGHELETTYTAAVATRATDPALAARFIALLTATDTAAARRHAGFA